ncbi:NAD(P)H-dependent oxidoreductase [Roseovarius sp. SK2]|uniref:NADPH-dependent FMN reductase n=1 Tax=Roseovarius TaxID=74030 RepID=UPI001475F933|nr:MULTISPECIES: NADPH-dependent FMN reductase [Roseovarius]MDD9725855.1 NAD(P)H-dependent oxidoreductase [Roseovarius sp. SK2]
MTKTLNFATISGSLRKGSHSTSVADTLQDLVPEGVTVTRHDIADIPLYNEDIKDGDTAPQPVRDLAEKLAAADAIIVVSPEYNRGTSGVLKNTIDWMSKEPNAPFSGKPTLIITQSPGATAGLTAHYDLRQVLSVINANVQAGFEIAIGGSAGKIEDGKLTDGNTRDFITKQLKRLTSTAAG